MCNYVYLSLSFLPVYVHVCVCCCVHTHTHTVCCNVEDSVLRVIRAAPPSIKVITFPKPGNFTDIIITFLSFSRSRSFSLSLSLSFTLSLSLSRTSAYGIYPKIFRNSDCVRYKYRGEIIAANTVLQNLRISPLSLSFFFFSFSLILPSLSLSSLSYRRRERNVASDSASRK